MVQWQLEGGRKGMGHGTKLSASCILDYELRQRLLELI